MERPIDEEIANSTISELLCLPFLDTDVEEKVTLADKELIRRGVPFWSIGLLRRICAVGLWTQIFAWEEWHLDIWDVLFGYSIIGLLSGFLVVVFGYAISTQALWFGGVVIFCSIVVFLVSAIGMRRARI